MVGFGRAPPSSSSSAAEPSALVNEGDVGVAPASPSPTDACAVRSPWLPAPARPAGA